MTGSRLVCSQSSTKLAPMKPAPPVTRIGDRLLMPVYLRSCTLIAAKHALGPAQIIGDARSSAQPARGDPGGICSHVGKFERPVTGPPLHELKRNTERDKTDRKLQTANRCVVNIGKP